MFGMSQQQQVALIQQMAQLQLMNGMQKSPNNLAGGKLHKKTALHHLYGQGVSGQQSVQDVWTPRTKWSIVTDQ